MTAFAAEEAEEYVYLDWAATAPLCEEAARAMEPFLMPGRSNVTWGGNANSLHSPGRAAFSALEDARRSLARDLHASRASEISFTSGATEADNAALLGLSHAALAARRQAGRPCAAPQIVVSAIEHDAVLEPARFLEREGFRVVRLAPNSQGFVEPEALERELCEDTVLVSVQMANSEVGSIQPVAQLSRAAHAAGALFHTDATQALGKVPIDLGQLDVDAASFSAHKVGGPKGVGALYVKARTPIEPFLLGGGQEGGRRSGTQNVCGIVGFAAASHAACELREREAARQRGLRDFLYGELLRNERVRATVEVRPGSEDYLPNIVHVLVSGLESQTLIVRFDSLGFGVSGGSACSSSSLEASHVLRSLGIPADVAHGALRVSLGRYTTQEDVHAFAGAMKTVLDWR